jgi:hypothetical protein
MPNGIPHQPLADNASAIFRLQVLKKAVRKGEKEEFSIWRHFSTSGRASIVTFLNVNKPQTANHQSRRGFMELRTTEKFPTILSFDLHAAEGHQLTFVGPGEQIRGLPVRLFKLLLTQDSLSEPQDGGDRDVRRYAPDNVNESGVMAEAEEVVGPVGLLEAACLRVYW